MNHIKYKETLDFFDYNSQNKLLCVPSYKAVISSLSKDVSQHNRSIEIAHARAKYKNISRYIVRTNAPDLNKLKQIYDFVHPQKIEFFLLRNKSIVKLLKQAESQIREFFVHENLSIEHQDGEEYQAGGELVLNIETKKNVEQSLSLFNNFERNWWSEMWIKTNSKLSINVTFIE